MATLQVAEVFRGRSRDEWRAFNDEHDAMIEPVLDLDEALDSDLVRAREMVTEVDQPGLGPVRLLGHPVKLSRTAADPTRAAPALGEHTEEILRDAGIDGDELSGPARVRRRRRPQRSGRPGAVSLMSAPAKEFLKISELSEASGVPVATIRHYLREGLLPEPVRTSRNMAYYPPEFVERIRRIKQLQEEQYMPLRVIRDVLDSSGGERLSEAEVLERFEFPERGLRRLEELGVLSPDERGYSPAEVRIIDAISRFRAAGWNETTGFGARDVARLMNGLEPVIADELGLLLERFAGLDPDRAAELLDGGATPFPDLIGALHAKALTDELERQRSGGRELSSGRLRLRVRLSRRAASARHQAATSRSHSTSARVLTAT